MYFWDNKCWLEVFGLKFDEILRDLNARCCCFGLNSATNRQVDNDHREKQTIWSQFSDTLWLLSNSCSGIQSKSSRDSFQIHFLFSHFACEFQNLLSKKCLHIGSNHREEIFHCRWLFVIDFRFWEWWALGERKKEYCAQILSVQKPYHVFVFLFFLHITCVFKPISNNHNLFTSFLKL